MLRNRLINFGLLTLSLLFSLLLGEGICRLIYNPLDMLSPELVKDSVLGHRIAPHSGGHDAWGFRNFSIPDSVDLAIIGDSQAWGINAKINESFPYQLSRMLNKTVYNFGVSGYGPVQYQYIMEQQAIRLKPSLVVVALYFGNDFYDSYHLVYQNDFWKHYRRKEFQYQPMESESHSAASVFLYRIRYWLNHKSIFYRLAKRKLESIVQHLRPANDSLVHYSNKQHNIDKFFYPSSRISVMNYDDANVQEGLRISLDCISSINRFCRQRNIQLVIAFIPTDIMVYSNYLYKNEALTSVEIFNAIIESEQKLKAVVQQRLEDEDILYIDTLDSLRAHTAHVLYPKFEDGHPSALGYEKIARAIAVKISSGLR